MEAAEFCNFGRRQRSARVRRVARHVAQLFFIHNNSVETSDVEVEVATLLSNHLVGASSFVIYVSFAGIQLCCVRPVCHTAMRPISPR